MKEAKQLSASTLAFVGDAVFGLVVRTRLSEIERPAGELHRLSVKLVNAKAQAKGYELIAGMLTEEEMAIYKRGRNNRVSQIPKSSSCAEYHSATGLECLFGYLYLKENHTRLKELFDVIWSALFG